MDATMERTVEIPTRDGDTVHGDLALPDGSSGLVVFAHGSGSSRFSPRNREVAEQLRERSLGTLLMDLLTAAEDETDRVTRQHRFDIPLLAGRLVAALAQLATDDSVPHARFGLFGASTGAAAALIAAAEAPARVASVVSRGGRPDLAGDALSRVQAPTLLLVGELDVPVIAMNREAAAQLRGPQELRIIPGATHLFEEPGALDEVSRQAAEWFLEHRSRDAAG